MNNQAAIIGKSWEAIEIAEKIYLNHHNFIKGRVAILCM
jgi:hypothetical protein